MGEVELAPYPRLVSGVAFRQDRRRKLRAHLLGVFLGTAIWVTTFPAKLTV